MKISRVDLSEEVKLLTNLIVSDRFCEIVIPMLRPDDLSSPFSRIVASWVMDYYREFKRAPGKDISSIYKSRKKELRDEDSTENLLALIKRIDDEWDGLIPNNPDYSARQSLLYMKKVSLEGHISKVQSCIDKSDYIKAEREISEYHRVENNLGEGVSILRDAAKVSMAFTDEEEILFKFPGALGDVAGELCRGDFVSFLAPMKRGKTWWLWYTAEIALRSQCKVVFFTLEMTEKAMVRRGWRSLIGQPWKDSSISIPRFVMDEESKKYRIEVTEEDRKGVDVSEIRENQRKLKRIFRKGDIRIISIPAYSATVEDIETHLDNIEHYDNFIPDVIIIDYADIVKATMGFRGEYRHQLDDIWKGHRRLAQERNALVVTASQAEKKTFTEDVRESHVAEDIRKLAHVTCMLALNQNKKEAEQGIVRVSQIAIREGRKVLQQAVVLQCLDIGRPYLDSHLRSEVIFDEPSPEEEGYKRRKNGKD